jgi:hypothetical protein
MSITIENAEHVTVQFGEQSNPVAKAFIASLFGMEGPQPSSASAAPRIGEVWPGQGGIYVGMGRGYDGKPDHHLILATDPRAVLEDCSLGTYGDDVKGSTSDHDGMANTVALAAAGSDLCKKALALEIEGHKDFYLMSRTDARLCMANVPEKFEKEWYLTSTQYSSSLAWAQHFSYGNQDDLLKSREVRARFVRRLVL